MITIFLCTIIFLFIMIFYCAWEYEKSITVKPIPKTDLEKKTEDIKTRVAVAACKEFSDVIKRV